MSNLKFQIALIAGVAGLAGCSGSRLASNDPTVPRTDLSQVKAEGVSQADKRIEQAKGWIAKLPHQPRGYNALGMALMQRGRETSDLDNYNAALTAFEKASSLASKDSESLHNLAWAWTMFHRFPKAISFAKRAIEIDPNDPFAWGVLVDSYMELGRYNEAADAAQKMVDQRPDLASYSRVAQVQWAFGDAKRAMFTMMKAAQAGGPYAENTAWCETQLGDMYWKTGAVEAASQTYERVLIRMPKYRHANFGKARILASKGKWQEALSFYEKAVQGNSPIPYVLEYGEALSLEGKSSDAQMQFDRVEEMVNEHLKHGIQGDELALAEFYLARNTKLDEALRLCESELKEHTAVGNYSAYAWALHLNGRDKEAWQAIEKAQKVGLRDARLWARAAAIRASLGKKDDAMKLMDAARSLNPNFDMTAPFGRPLMASR